MEFPPKNVGIMQLISTRHTVVAPFLDFRFYRRIIMQLNERFIGLFFSGEMDGFIQWAIVLFDWEFRTEI